jgi:hypothetical protein
VGLVPDVATGGIARKQLVQPCAAGSGEMPGYLTQRIAVILASQRRLGCQGGQPFIQAAPSTQIVFDDTAVCGAGRFGELLAQVLNVYRDVRRIVRTIGEIGVEAAVLQAPPRPRRDGAERS